MKHYLDITTRYLKLHKKRTLLTMVGIIMSIALVSALGTLIYSFGDNRIESTKASTGDYEVSFSNLSMEQANILQNHVELKNVSFMVNIGDAKIYDTPKDQLKDSTPKYRYLFLKAYNETAFNKTFKPQLLEGTYPSKKGEIIIEKRALSYLPEGTKLGDKINLSFGKRTIPNNKSNSSFNSWSSDEIFDVNYKEDYTLVGIVKNNSFSTNSVTYNAFTYFSPSSENKNVKAYANIVSKQNKKQIASKIAEAIDPNINLYFNEPLLKYYAQGKNVDFNKSLIGIIVFILSLIAICTIAVIYNSFNISVIERINQFGILRSIGATPKQIRKIVFKEALLMSAIAIPLGLISGVAAMKILVLIMGNIDFLGEGQFTINIHGEVLIISGLIGFLTILASVIVPVRTAGKVSPLEAVRNPNLLKMGAIKKVSKAGLYKFLFKVEGLIAYKNITRNRKRFIVTVFSLTISIIMFITFNSFVKYVKLSSGTSKLLYHDAHYAKSDGAPFTEKDYDEIKKVEGIDKIYKSMQAKLINALPIDKLNPNYEERTTRKPYYDIYKNYALTYNSELLGFSEEAIQLLNSHLITGKVDTAALDNMGVILINRNRVINKNSKQVIEDFTNYKVGDTIKVPKISNNSNSSTKTEDIKTSIDNNNFWSLKIIAIAESEPFMGSTPQDSINLITSEKTYEKIIGNKDFTYIPLKLSEDEIKREQVVKFFIDKAEQGNYYFEDYKISSEKQQRSALEISVLVYGFIVVITLISSVNIVNTINTNLLIRKREFATLQAIGMTQGQLKKLIYLEGSLHGIIASILGGIMGTILTYLLHRIVTESFEISWQIPINSIFISSIGAIILTLLSSSIPINKIKSQNIVDTIRMEE